MFYNSIVNSRHRLLTGLLRLLTLDRFEEVPGGFEPSVGAMVSFGGESHGSAVGASGICQLVVAVRKSVSMTAYISKAVRLTFHYNARPTGQ